MLRRAKGNPVILAGLIAGLLFSLTNLHGFQKERETQ